MTAHPKGAAILVCAGRPVTDHGQPVGEPCGRAISLSRNPRWDALGPAAALLELVQIARAAGWAVSDRLPDGGHDAMCPTCRRPSPELVRLTKELTR